MKQLPEGHGLGHAREGPQWIERVPPERHLSWAGFVLVLGVAAYALFLPRSPDWVAAVEALLLLASLAVVFLSPVRVGPALSLGAVALFIVLLAAGGRFGDGLQPSEIGVAFALLAAMLGASYMRLGIRRRDSELEVAAAAIAELTQRDRITELLSGGHEVTWLESELARARRHHHKLSLVLIEPDRLDELEPLGEEAVVEVLEAVAEVIGSELRATDIALRRGAATFSLIFPETSSEGARVAAERVRLFVPARMGELSPGEGMATVSAGVAAFPFDAATNQDLIRVAERALARARELGGNRTVCASIEGHVPPGWTLAGSPPGDGRPPG